MATFYIEAIEATTIEIEKGMNFTPPAAKYGINDPNTPTAYTYETSITLQAGQKCYWSIASSSRDFDGSRYIYFESTGRINVGGELSDLIGGETAIPRKFCFYRLFYNCANLIDASNLTLVGDLNGKDYCYNEMFSRCTSLTRSPASIPATVLTASCCSNMFNGCSSLTTAPELPATTLANYCYESMFYGCLLLAVAPELPATTLANNCYKNMFTNCRSITTAPELPATTLKNSCYSNMFKGCTSLVATPELPATTLGESCYSYMFNGCSSLVTAPTILPATVLTAWCYQSMFAGCSLLTVAPELPAAALESYCYAYMFSNCSSLAAAPELPAITLKQNCYMNMFYGCVSLTTLPKLPATTLETECYEYMFYGCTGIKLSETRTEEYSVLYRIPSNGNIDYTPYYALDYMFGQTGGIFKGTPAINTTYYLYKTPLPPLTLDPKQIILFPPTETAFNNNGIGHLSDAISCLVTEERNGAFELELQYPISGDHYGDIAQRSVILAKSRPNDDGQYFRIYRITKPINGIVTVYAAHISYDLAGTIVEPFTAGSASAAMAYLENASVGDNGFTFQTDKTTVATMQVKVPSSVRSLLGGSENSVLDIYGGEWEFDRFNCYLHNNRGQDRGFTIRYGKNLTDLTQEENCASVYTAVYPYWSSSEGDTVVTLPEKTIDVADVISGAHYDYSKVLVADFSGDYQEQPTVTELRNHTEAYIRNNNVGIPSVSLSVSFVQLEQTAEYQDMAIAQQIYLCDTVSVEFEKLGVSAKAKVIKTVYNALLDRYEKIEIGDAKMSIADTIANQQEEIKRLDPANIMSDVEAAAIRASQLITGNRGGYVVLHSSTGATTPDEILVMDTPDIQTAQKVWRWNNSGLGYSSTGYNGTYTSAWTIAGAFNADFITAGSLSANRIKGGTIENIDQTNMRTTIDLNSGKMILYYPKPSTNEIFRMEFWAGGMTLYKFDNQTQTETHLGSFYISTAGTGIVKADRFIVSENDTKAYAQLNFNSSGGNFLIRNADATLNMVEIGNNSSANCGGYVRVLDESGQEKGVMYVAEDSGMLNLKNNGKISFGGSYFASKKNNAIDVAADTLKIYNGGIDIVNNSYIKLNGTSITSWDDITPPAPETRALVVYGYPSVFPSGAAGYYSTAVIPKEEWGINHYWQIADESNWVRFEVNSNGSVTNISASGGGDIVDWYKI